MEKLRSFYLLVKLSKELNKIICRPLYVGTEWKGRSPAIYEYVSYFSARGIVVFPPKEMKLCEDSVYLAEVVANKKRTSLRALRMWEVVLSNNGKKISSYDNKIEFHIKDEVELIETTSTIREEVEKLISQYHINVYKRIAETINSFVYIKNMDNFSFDWIFEKVLPFAEKIQQECISKIKDKEFYKKWHRTVIEYKYNLGQSRNLDDLIKSTKVEWRQPKLVDYSIYDHENIRDYIEKEIKEGMCSISYLYSINYRVLADILDIEYSLDDEIPRLRDKIIEKVTNNNDIKKHGVPLTKNQANTLIFKDYFNKDGKYHLIFKKNIIEVEKFDTFTGEYYFDCYEEIWIPDKIVTPDEEYELKIES